MLKTLQIPGVFVIGACYVMEENKKKMSTKRNTKNID